MGDMKVKMHLKQEAKKNKFNWHCHCSIASMPVRADKCVTCGSYLIGDVLSCWKCLTKRPEDFLYTRKLTRVDAVDFLRQALVLAKDGVQRIKPNVSAKQKKAEERLEKIQKGIAEETAT